MSQFTNLWRTLIRVAAVDEHKCCVLIPAWNTSEIICIDISNIPEDIRPVLWPGKRLHAEVNIGAEKAEDLMFANWEKD